MPEEAADRVALREWAEAELTKLEERAPGGGVTKIGTAPIAKTGRDWGEALQKPCLADRAADLRRPNAAAHNPRSVDCRRAARRGKRGCTAR